MSTVMLVSCPINIRRRGQPQVLCEGDEHSNTPLGILYLAASLRKAGFGVSILDPTPQNLCLEDIIERIEKERPLLIGFSIMTSGTRVAVLLAREIKKAIKEPPLICLGGPHINSDPEFVNRFPVFDFAIAGEAEITIVEIARRIEAGERPRGVVYAKPAQNLDDLPFPARDLVDINAYYRPEANKKILPTATMIMSRGCPFHCIFCSRPVFRRTLRVRSAKNVVDEMESIAAAHGDRFSFVDDTLTLHRETIEGICDEILKRGCKFKWMGMTRATCLDNALAVKLKKAGCDDLFIGVESGNERIRNEIIKKNVTNEAIFRAIKICRRRGIHTNIFMILGFPTETRKEINDTITFGRRCKADLMGIRILVPLPGADIFEYAVKNGILPADIVDRYASGELGEGFVGKWPLFVPEGLKLEDLVEAKKKAYLNFYFNPGWFLRRGLFYFKQPARLRDDIRLFRVLPHVLLFGKTKGAMS